MRSRPQPTLQQVLERLQQIRSRLDLLAVGDRAVRASFELSWQMLDPPLQELFAALALFAGRPFHPDAVAALTGEPEAAWRLADLAALSLVQDAGGDYCRQHALLADFAREKLPAAGLDEATLEQRLAALLRRFRRRTTTRLSVAGPGMGQYPRAHAHGPPPPRLAARLRTRPADDGRLVQARPLHPGARGLPAQLRRRAHARRRRSRRPDPARLGPRLYRAGRLCRSAGTP
jgi:hypothetical protein